MFQSECPFCLSAAILDTLYVKEMYKGTREIFEYAICANCESSYMVQIPSDMSKYYKDYYSFEDDTPGIDKSKLKRLIVNIYSIFIIKAGLSYLVRPLFRSPSSQLAKYLTPNLQAFLFIAAKTSARILDVGSGSGQFVKVMRRLGYKSSIGIDAFLVENSRREHVSRSDTHSITGVYDVILFNHSFEHIADPLAVLKKCASLLSLRGTVAIHVPNIHSREFKKYRENWWGIHAPYHFFVPSRKGIELLAARCGLQISDSICTSRADHYLYSDDYSRDISDVDRGSIRRKLESGSFDRRLYVSLRKLACVLNKSLAGDWIVYYLARS